MSSLFRIEIEKMSGYKPGEQPSGRRFIKLNTNENPYPPSPKIKKFLRDLDISILRLYPDPEAREIRKIIGEKFGLSPDNIIVGNGSDDILTIAVRACAGQGRAISCFEPSYSLYSILAQIQGAECVKAALNEDFSMPSHIPPLFFKSAIIMAARPNAPTGNSFTKEKIADLCRRAAGIVLVDEAYADFAEDDCIDLLKKFDNLVICRTLSKSYSLAGIRLGFAMASKEIIAQMMKVKDSYNVNRLSQEIAKIAIMDEKYFRRNINKIKKTRQILIEGLKNKKWKVFPTNANFVFAEPPRGESAESYCKRLKKRGIFVRWFGHPLTSKFVRISVGTEKEIRALLKET